MKIPVVASSVFHRHAAPPAANVALSISVPGCAFWPGSPCPSAWQPMTGTRESRGKLITTAPWCWGRMCSSIIVSDRAPAMACALPNWPFVPARLSEPITRMFIAAVLYWGGRLPSRWETSTWRMPSTTLRYAM